MKKATPNTEQQRTEQQKEKGTWGGKREGAGRPPLGRKRVSFQLTPAEKPVLRAFLADLRAGKAWASASKLEAAYEEYATKALALHSEEGRNGAYRALKAVALLRGMTAGAVDGEMRVRRKAWEKQREEEIRKQREACVAKLDEMWQRWQEAGRAEAESVEE